VKKTVKEFGKLANNVDARVGGLSTGFDKTMSGFDKTMSAARGILSENSPLGGRFGEHAAGDFRHESVNSAVGQLS